MIKNQTVRQSLADGRYNTIVPIPSAARLMLAGVSEALFRELNQIYRDDFETAQERFKHDLEIENDIFGNKKADTLFELAWNKGQQTKHGPSLEVITEYERLSALVK